MLYNVDHGGHKNVTISQMRSNMSKNNKILKIPHIYLHWLLKKTYKRGDISQKPKGLEGGETLPLLYGFQME